MSSLHWLCENSILAFLQFWEIDPWNKSDREIMYILLPLFVVACDATTDCSGQGTCNEDGTCSCNAGFVGSDCSGKCYSVLLVTINNR